ncbi:hypothetical protein [Sphingomonas sp. NFR15]|uniref:hypothetical protein n=1 Tax=Sphingomonas sp. NFR15 TaxID=1566282 RepID=UPI0008887A53|nr:hypothetical protein [Sphingomonas sp. NFR15]SDA14868.1 hypothetical protein SAMN03159340_00606 [Sphingomonas sp. NFR15]
MIWKGFLPLAAAVPVAVAATDGKVAAMSEPTIWSVLGYQFEAGSMIAALCACFAVRFWAVQKDYARHRWSLDIPVAALALMFTAAAVISVRPSPLVALLLGTGLGVLGAGIIAIAKKYVDRWLGGITGSDPTP